jgi:hypothetical protein
MTSPPRRKCAQNREGQIFTPYCFSALPFQSLICDASEFETEPHGVPPKPASNESLNSAPFQIGLWVLTSFSPRKIADSLRFKGRQLGRILALGILSIRSQVEVSAIAVCVLRFACRLFRQSLSALAAFSTFKEPRIAKCASERAFSC